GAILQLRPSTVFKQAFAASGLASFSLNQVAHSASARNAGIRSDSACSVESERIKALAGTVAKTHARSGSAAPTLKLSQRNAAAVISAGTGSIVHCSQVLGVICLP